MVNRLIEKLHAHTSFEIEEIRALLRSHCFDQDELKEFISEEPDDGDYVRTSVYACDDFEVVVLRWGPHAQTQAHDHGREGTCGVVRVLSGRIENRVMACDDGSVTLDRVRAHDAGEIMQFGTGIVHRMANPDDCEAISVHVYFPRMVGVTYFD